MNVRSTVRDEWRRRRLEEAFVYRALIEAVAADDDDYYMHVVV